MLSVPFVVPLGEGLQIGEIPRSAFGTQIGSTTLLALLGIAFLAGVGITAIGPGGIFTTVGLAGLTAVPASTVAGTAHLTFVATGLLGTIAYLRSGELAGGRGRTLTIVLSGASVLGAIAGALANTAISDELFGLLLGGFCVLVGGIIAYREYRGLGAAVALDPGTRNGRLVIGAVGLVIGLLGGLLGVGGPVVAVPALVLLGSPMLVALAAAQVQSIVLSGTAAVTYLAAGTVSLPLAALIGLPQLAGVLVGWRLAHRVPSGRLKVVLAVVLVAIGPLLVF